MSFIFGPNPNQTAEGWLGNTFSTASGASAITISRSARARCATSGLSEQSNRVSRSQDTWFHNRGVESTQSPNRRCRVASLRADVIHCRLNAASVNAQRIAGKTHLCQLDDRLAGAETLAQPKQ